MSDRSRLSPQARALIRKALGAEQAPALFVPAADGSRAPVLHDEIAIQKFVEQDCGADGWAIKNGKLIAVRWRDGAAFPLKSYEIDAYGAS